MSAILLILAAIFTALAAHPFVTYPLSLALLRRLRRASACLAPAGSSMSRPSFSLLVCAHNEEQVIADKAANLKQLLERAPGPAEALVYVDGSSDGTARVLQAHGHPRIRVVVSAERTGKTVGLNRLAGMAHGDILVLSDANVMVEPDALAKLARHFADPEVGLVCGHLRYVNGDATVTARNGTAYWRLEELIRQLESDTGSAIGADGSLYAVRRGLWPSVPADIIDDFYVPMMVRFRGLRVTRAGEIEAYERSAEDARDEFRRKVRIACQAFNVHRRLWPVTRTLGALDLYKYVSHKLLKWLIGFNLALAGVCLLAAGAFAYGWPAAAAAGALAFLVFRLAVRLRVRPFPGLWDALRMFAAVALGVIRSLQGERFQTWQPAGSVRAGQLSLTLPPTQRAS